MFKLDQISIRYQEYVFSSARDYKLTYENVRKVFQLAKPGTLSRDKSAFIQTFPVLFSYLIYWFCDVVCVILLNLLLMLLLITLILIKIVFKNNVVLIFFQINANCKTFFLIYHFFKKKGLAFIFDIPKEFQPNVSKEFEKQGTDYRLEIDGKSPVASRIVSDILCFFVLFRQNLFASTLIIQ